MYTNILGYSEEEIYKNALEFAENYFHPDDKQLAIDRIKKFRKNEINSWSGVYRIKHKDEHWVWVYSRFNVFQRNKDGFPAQLIGLLMDTTNNFSTKDQIRELYKERLRGRKLAEINKLTERESEIICLIAQGKTYIEIAETLSIQPDTVNKHRKKILNKLNLNNIAALVCFAKEMGLA